MSSPEPFVRIGNAQAFWGDRSDAAANLLAQQPDLDYLTLDYLAEVSMSILAVQRQRDPAGGFARDFIEVVRSLIPYWATGGRCRLITNAGGLEPRACAVACQHALEQAGCRSLRVGVVTGDDLSALFQSPAHASALPDGLSHFDSSPTPDRVLPELLTANAYLGAEPVLRALHAGADIVITGRVADPSLTVAAAAHHFGWSLDDWDRLAGATVAGHLIECGTQVTGGILSDWLDVPDPGHIGYPVAEIYADGSCVITKPNGTGGCVNEQTVKEQLLYEIGDPDSYLSPDVTLSFLSLHVRDLGQNRVRVTGSKGSYPSKTLKVSATYQYGFRAAGTLLVCGPDAVAKARRCGQIVLQRVAEAGWQLRDSVVEFLGAGDCLAGVLAASPASQIDVDGKQLPETVLRISVEAESREAVERFTREMMPLVTAGPQGITGYSEGRPRIHEVIRYLPLLVDRALVTAEVELFETANSLTEELAGDAPRVSSPTPNPIAPSGNGTIKAMQTKTIIRSAASPATLREFAYARSGDKGSDANVGIIARREEHYERLRDWLTADRVAVFFAPLGVDAVKRFELPNLHALNFILHGALRRSVRTDVQGKAFGQALLSLPLDDR